MDIRKPFDHRQTAACSTTKDTTNHIRLPAQMSFLILLTNMNTYVVLPLLNQPSKRNIYGQNAPLTSWWRISCLAAAHYTAWQHICKCHLGAFSLCNGLHKTRADNTLYPMICRIHKIYANPALTLPSSCWWQKGAFLIFPWGHFSLLIV